MYPHRLASLKEVIIPGREKEDQAGFLISAATYIRQLQVCLLSLLTTPNEYMHRPQTVLYSWQGSLHWAQARLLLNRGSNQYEAWI